jgi:mono/diheme cytochrome c family protein
MKWTILSLVAVGAVLAIVQGLGLFAEQTSEEIRIPYENPVAVARGQEIYVNACAACHGQKLEGQQNWNERGPDGRLPAPPHNEKGHTWHHADRQLFEITKYGTAAFAPQGYQTDMRGYEDVLTDNEILDVLAYIKAQWPASIQKRHDALTLGSN